jgi:iron complex outermembrane receptor protein
MRVAVVATAICTSIIGLCIADPSVAAATRKQTDIPSQELALALQALAKDRDFQIVCRADLVKDLRSSELSGEFTPYEAVAQLLNGTGLTYQALDDKTLTIVPLPSGGGKNVDPKNESAGRKTNDSGSVKDATPPTAKEAQKASSFWDRFRLAQVDQGRAPNDRSVDSPSNDQQSSKVKLEEIVVTATKRAENIQDVPISITAVTSEEIDRRGLVGAEDYLRGMPGVNQVTQKLGESIAIRGIETTPEQQNFSSGTTVATYFGETPTTNTAGVGGGTNVDIKLVDIERVEVLRGPQGTAFGNSSLGGAVRTIPATPTTDRFEGKVAANYSATSGNGGDNSMIQAVGNIPLIQDKLAIRAVAYQFQDEGFYRNVAGSDQGFLAAAASFGAEAFATDQDRVGDNKFTGGRISALFRANDDLKLTLSYLTQSTEADSAMHSGGQTNGAAAYDQAMLQIAPEEVTRGQTHGFYDSDIDLANATMEYNLSRANVLATFSHIKSSSDHAQPIFVAAIPWSARGNSDHTENSGELRLTTQLDGAWNFLGGLYAEELKDDYTEDSFWYGSLESEPSVLGITARDVYLLREQRKLKQEAVFGEVSWNFLSKWTLTGGMRYYDYDRTGNYHLTGAFGEQLLPTNGNASGTSFRGNLSYKFNADAMMYAAYSEGFRLGKPQPGLPAATCDVNGDGILDGTTGITLASTREFKSDEIKSYELGGKFTLLDGRLLIAADVFSIDWAGVPFRVFAPSPTAGGCGLAFNSNAGGARSEGIEFQASLYATQAFRIDVGSSFIHAELSKDAPLLPAPAFEGDRLPGSPRVNASLALQYEFNVVGYPAFVRADSIYVGSFYGDLQTSPKTRAGDYVKVDATARVAIKNLSVDLFVRNLTDADNFTYHGVGGEGSAFFGYRLRPRTIGLQLGYTF